jgi:hypothetical protein
VSKLGTPGESFIYCHFSEQGPPPKVLAKVAVPFSKKAAPGFFTAAETENVASTMKK